MEDILAATPGLQYGLLLDRDQIARRDPTVDGIHRSGQVDKLLLQDLDGLRWMLVPKANGPVTTPGHESIG